MDEQRKTTVTLDPNGFNELRTCRSGPMLYNKNDVFVGGSLQKYGEFSVEEQELFAQIVRPGSVVVEAGANIGAHTVVLSRLAGPDGEVHAFEPQRIVFQALCANLALNQCMNVHARQAAVGKEAGTAAVPAFDPTVRNNFGGVSLCDVSWGEAVPLLTLDGLDLPACAMLKADVEGAEVEVLLGAQQLLQTHRPILYLENDRAERSEELLGLVERLDYKAYWHKPRLFNPANFYGETVDIFPGVVCVNILCIPRETNRMVQGLRPVTSPQDTWRTPAR